MVCLFASMVGSVGSGYGGCGGSDDDDRVDVSMVFAKANVAQRQPRPLSQRRL